MIHCEIFWLSILFSSELSDFSSSFLLFSIICRSVSTVIGSFGMQSSSKFSKESTLIWFFLKNSSLRESGIISSIFVPIIKWLLIQQFLIVSAEISFHEMAIIRIASWILGFQFLFWFVYTEKWCFFDIFAFRLASFSIIIYYKMPQLIKELSVKFKNKNIKFIDFMGKKHRRKIEKFQNFLIFMVTFDFTRSWHCRIR